MLPETGANDLECHPVLEAPSMGPVPVSAVFALPRLRTRKALLQRNVREVRVLRRGAPWRNMPSPKGRRALKVYKLHKDRLRGHRTWGI
ncbi:hypothetical protein EVAR_93479_1 [Eumeta japonica]|uniref:Uncharacterized protein n=1 Tax=Eumeta variegata TaxID=151549 RepID=A0A4C1TKG8_EUMVA|nr:hypothetical protein EVAR_93479_1 [Eumeta japonica]